MQTSDFDFDLPDDLIALRPADQRDHARLLAIAAGEQPPGLRNLHIRDLPDLLAPGDALVFNDTKVLAALLKGQRTRGASQVAMSINLLRRLSDTSWLALAKPARRLQVGDNLQFQAPTSPHMTLDGRVSAVGPAGQIEIMFDVAASDLDAAIDRVGLMPLPHYIASKRAPDGDDRRHYQTMFAARSGAVAAPTAGLHFTPDVIQRLKQRGVSCHALTLHVGGGTFLPVKSETIEDHKMHKEWGEVTAETAERLNACRQAGGRIVAVGTTSLRLLESAARDDGTIGAFCGDTDIFITPGYRFKAVDRLLTNFHLPKSTLFMLVSAFSGLSTMKLAYAHAVQSGYRFYSYGDACLLDRQP